MEIVQTTNNAIEAVNALLIAPETPDHLIRGARKFRKMLFSYLENLHIKQTSINFATSTEGANVEATE